MKYSTAITDSKKKLITDSINIVVDYFRLVVVIAAPAPTPVVVAAVVSIPEVFESVSI